MFKVIKTFYWHHRTTNTGTGGLTSQVTICQYKDILFFVRENINGISSFLISSGERWGDKVGLKRIRKERQTLELLCREDKWEEIAVMIHEVDEYHRPVLRNERFTENWVRSNCPPHIRKYTGAQIQKV